jgi:hypothetical protein
MSTAVPEHLMPHTVTIVRPAVSTDTYNNEVLDYGTGATRTEVAAWLQQNARREQLADGRTAQDQRWLMIINHADVQALDRFEWDGPAGPLIFETDGPPAPTYSPGGLHHTEVGLHLITG